MCGNWMKCRDNRRRFCDGCRKVRKHFLDRHALEKLRKNAKLRRLKEQEELEGLRTENEILRERIMELEAIVRGFNG